MAWTEDALCQLPACAVPVPHLDHGTKYLSADDVTEVWRPGPRPDIGQYTVTLVATGDDLGPAALGSVIPPILTSALGMSSVHVLEVRRGYPSMPARPRPPSPTTPPAATPAVRVHRNYDRSVIVYVDGTEVASGDYDEYGWSGLDMIETLASEIARAAGLTLETCEGPDGERCDDGDHDV